ncbi:hypothetical protein [Streptomyces sp. STR69]|uniref:DUF7739 domain-containing protein n=1 Tax=Streptomyces sp. STR69 TaxID=1796942 RepID=UPI0021C96AF8|nr:hypothetical protein [Streptomyces sp. STR69]
MGWNISHGTNPNGEVRRSYTSVDNLAKQLAHVLPAADWRSIAYVFNRPSGDPFTVLPHEADRIANILMRAAHAPLTPRNWQGEAEAFAMAAATAADADEPWIWR